MLFRQNIIAGCAGGLYDNLCEAAAILRGRPNDDFDAYPNDFHIYPASEAVLRRLNETGIAKALTDAGAHLMPSFCGPCFGTLDIPHNGEISLRHVTRNYIGREGADTAGGQSAAVALADARTIAATVKNGGRLTPATETEYIPEFPPYLFERELFMSRVYDGFGRPEHKTSLRMGPGIGDFPEMPAMPDNLILKVVGSYRGSVTTDELIPSGPVSALRSNPQRLADFTLSGRDPGYPERAKGAQGDAALAVMLERLREALPDWRPEGSILCGSVICAEQIGDGSTREHAASCQKVLGGWADIAREYSTKRYLTNLINWGVIPFETPLPLDFEVGSLLVIPDIARKIAAGAEVTGWMLGSKLRSVTLKTAELSDKDREVLLSGGLINFNKSMANTSLR